MPACYRMSRDGTSVGLRTLAESERQLWAGGDAASTASASRSRKGATVNRSPFIKRQFETAGLQTAGAGQSLKVSVDEPCAVWLL